MVLLSAAPHCPRPNAPRASARAGQRGFTLIELIAVIIILGILAAIIAPRFAGLQDDVLQAAAKGAASEAITRLRGATSLYAVNTGLPPQQLDDIANPQYLNLDGGNRVSIGSYDAAYSYAQASGEVTVRISSSGDATVLYTATIDWP